MSKKNEVIEHKILFWFLLQILCEIFFCSKKNIGRYHKCAWVFTWSTRYSCQILIKLEFSGHIFEKIVKYQIWMWTSSSGSRVFPCGLADIHDESNSLFSQFFSNAPVLQAAFFVPGKRCYHPTGDKCSRNCYTLLLTLLHLVCCRSRSVQSVCAVDWTIGESVFDSPEA
jgi:hypothetical protein